MVLIPVNLLEYITPHLLRMLVRVLMMDFTHLTGALLSLAVRISLVVLVYIITVQQEFIQPANVRI